MPIDAVPEQVSCDVSIAKSLRKRIALIYDASDRHVATAEVLMWRVVEIAIGMGIMQSAVLSKRFYEIATLHSMQQRVPAIVRAI